MIYQTIFKGTFDGVSMEFLMQTLEKNLMSNLNKVKSFNERAKGENHEFSSGRKFEADKAHRKSQKFSCHS